MWTDQKCRHCGGRLREKKVYYTCTSSGSNYFYDIYCQRNKCNDPEPKSVGNHG